MRVRGNPFVFLGSALLVCAILAAGGITSGAPVPDIDLKKEDPKKEDPKKDQPGKEKPKIELVPQPGFPALPDLELVLPPGIGIDMEQIKRLREEMKKAQDDARRAVEDLQKRFPGGFPGGVPGIAFDPLIGPLGGIDPRGVRGNARLGARLSKPSETIAEQLDLPKDQGLVIEKVEDGSAAARAGLKAHDILLELAGQPVSNRVDDLATRIKDMKADEAVEAVVLRKGKKETIKGLTLPEVKPVRAPVPFPFPNVFPGVPGGVGGANLSMIRNNDRYTTTFTEGGLEIKVNGTVTAGVATLEEATITENGTATKYASLDKVPETHQARVKELVEMSATGKVQFKR